VIHRGAAAEGRRALIFSGVGRLIYSAIASLDGYVEDGSGKFDWAAPDAEVHGFVNDLEREIGIHLYGRRMYETMVFWETAGKGDDEPPVFRDYAEIWRAADKVVFSRSMTEVTTERTRLEREFDPGLIVRLKDESATNLSIGGAEIAGQAITLGLVDEIQLLLCPIIVGGGKRALPAEVLTRLELCGERSFGGGDVFLRYGVGG
jgi:dihydrofolate reductase